MIKETCLQISVTAASLRSLKHTLFSSNMLRPFASMETMSGPNSFTLQHHRVSGMPSSSQWCSAMRHVAAGHQVAVQIDDVSNVDVLKVLGAHGRDQHLFAVSDFNHTVTSDCRVIRCAQHWKVEWVSQVTRNTVYAFAFFSTRGCKIWEDQPSRTVLCPFLAAVRFGVNSVPDFGNRSLSYPDLLWNHASLRLMGCRMTVFHFSGTTLRASER